MSDIRITRQHGLADEAAARAEVERLAKDLVGRFGGRWHWRGEVAVCDIRGARGEVRCQGDSVTMQVKLPILMKAFRSPLEQEIKRQFDNHFQPPA